MQAHSFLRAVGQGKEKTLRLRTARTVLRKGAPVFVAAATLAGLTLSGAGAAAAQAPPQHSGNVSIGATISGSGINPAIECSWVLTDDNLAGGGKHSNTRVPSVPTSGRVRAQTSLSRCKVMDGLG